jgi:SET domain-containing protein
MLLVPVKVRYDDHTGTAIYADTVIPKGTRVWEFYPLLDRMFHIAKIRRLPPLAQIFLYKYAWKERRIGLYILDADASMYMSHSDNANLTYGFDTKKHAPIFLANKLIRANAKITCNYNEFLSDKEDDAQVWKNMLANAGYNPNTFDLKMFFGGRWD